MRQSKIGTEKMFEAIEFATRAHANQCRKGTKIPYIIHPLQVAKILIESDCPNHVVIAGILHDTVEDTPVTLNDIRSVFGKQIMDLVNAVSEPDKSDPWDLRKEHTIESLKTDTPNVLFVSLADKLDNIRAIKDDYAKVGDSVWERFRRPYDKQKWYYESLAEVFGARTVNDQYEFLTVLFDKDVETVFNEALHNKMKFTQ